MDTEKGKPITTLYYIPNIIGYSRVVLLFIALICSSRMFVILYSVSYLLDALDGYAARILKQESQLGYILDMATDRASSAILIIKTITLHPKMFIPLCGFLIVDIISHMFCIVHRCVSKTSHKVHAGSGLIDRVLSFYYIKPVLFIVCLGSEVFLLNSICLNSTGVYLICGGIFAFKNLTNMLQLYKAAIGLSKE
ncbi:CDP-diacylglycerol--inositol 3-phosphatidyltransferase [Nematocida sp. AWRm78]|nr:CDP-diacylglycerol--inositol 3-phosphatidyltransferase [Nematocida sp. AWRm79]KAI5183082.1 CDP-diacylglycerol--inositol 3-phosphatidyltransferase [Nematocida sp. AWRm78]